LQLLLVVLEFRSAAKSSGKKFLGGILHSPMTPVRRQNGRKCAVRCLILST
jgi:hypothetical protein